MHFRAKTFLRVDGIVVNQHDMGGNDFGEVFQFTDHAGDMLMKRR